MDYAEPDNLSEPCRSFAVLANELWENLNECGGYSEEAAAVKELCNRFIEQGGGTPPDND